MDYYTVSGSRIFDFGGLTLSASVDKRGNFSTYLTYNISFSKEPDKWNILTSANSKLSGSGSIYATFHDDDGNPLEGVGVTANNMVKEQYTDEDGAVFITDLVANEKTILNIDMETLEDVSLKPDSEIKKLVLRPGTLKELDFEFKHYGSVEGQIANPYGKRLYGYKVSATNEKGEELAATFSDLEGYFIIPDVPYGTVNIVVSKDNIKQAEIKNVNVDDLDIMLENEIETPDAMVLPQDYMDEFVDEDETQKDNEYEFYDEEEKQALIDASKDLPETDEENLENNQVNKLKEKTEEEPLNIELGDIVDSNGQLIEKANKTSAPTKDAGENDKPERQKALITTQSKNDFEEKIKSKKKYIFID